MKVVAVIPVRLDSKRLPGKALREVAGKPLVRWVYERVKTARRLDGVWIATDSPEVERACREFTSDIFLSRREHSCGTDRVAEAVADLDAEVIVNVQGDEPMMDADLIDVLVGLFDDPEIRMASAATRIHTIEDLLNPNIVKVVCDANGDALYFSRAPIPWPRDDPPRGKGPLPDRFRAYRHIGIYLYRYETLRTLASFPADRIETTERLEQLRALGRGIKIRILDWDYRGIDVDTVEGLKKFESTLRADGG